MEGLHRNTFVVPKFRNFYSTVCNFIFYVLLCGIIFFNSVFVNVAQERVLNEVETSEAKKLLSDLGYWIESVDSSIDESTYYAVLAFQRVSKLKPDGQLSFNVLEKIRNSKSFDPKYKGYFHIEIDVSRKILFYVNPDGNINHILPVATGTNKLFTQDGKIKKARTPRGTFKVYRKIEGWRESPLGKMYYPNYIIGGVAIHGSNKIPNYPTTYGCIAIPIYAAQKLSETSILETIVVIY